MAILLIFKGGTCLIKCNLYIKGIKKRYKVGDLWTVQHAMCRSQNTTKNRIRPRTLCLCVVLNQSVMRYTDCEGELTICFDRLFQSWIVRGKNEYWCAFNLDCGNRYAWVLQCLVGRLIGVMHSFTTITTTYLTTYSLWSNMHELSLLLIYQVYRWKGTSSFLQL